MSSSRTANLASLVFALSLSTVSQAAPEVEVQDPEKKLSVSEMALVKQATEIALERLPSTDVAKCAKRNSWRGQPHGNQWEKDMGFLRHQDKIVVRILPAKLDRVILGQALVGSARETGPHGRWTEVSITLNQENLAYWQPTSERDLDQWTNTVAHEIGHTFGLKHGTSGADWEENYAGYFVTELGFCVASEGRAGSDRGDLDIRRKRKDRFGQQVW